MPPRAIRGTFRSGKLVLQTELRDQPIRVGERDVNLRIRTRYELTLTGDLLSGTQRIVAPSDPSFDLPPRPIKATRQKA